MLKANQAQVIQKANNDMVNLRSAEINYFTGFFSSFGTQAALISSICVNSVSQVPGLGCPCSAFWTYLYWITTALCLCSSIHVLLCTVYISVYGQGLALRGPLGSMARAVDGMIIEQEQVVTAFVFSLFCLAISLMGTYGIMMTLPAAIITSILTFFGMIVWYHYSLRIYNRFYFETKNDWQTQSDALDEQFPDPDEYTRGTQAKMRQETVPAKKTQKKSMLNFLSRPSASDDNYSTMDGSNERVGGNFNPISGASTDNSGNGNNASVIASAQSATTQLHSGYLSMKSGGLFSSPWVRRFVVLRGSYLIYYANKIEFEQRPQNSINKRPINFERFDVNVEITDAFYCIILTPGKGIDDEEISTLKSWEFRCDTQAELDDWRDAFTAASAINNNSTSVGQQQQQLQQQQQKAKSGSVFNGN